VPVALKTWNRRRSGIDPRRRGGRIEPVGPVEPVAQGAEPGAVRVGDAHSAAVAVIFGGAVAACASGIHRRLASPRADRETQIDAFYTLLPIPSVELGKCNAALQASAGLNSNNAARPHAIA